tara:strand:- start:247 stop:492 length:246 start_codon:yes stop_codon:yes gene_type:complete
MYEKSGMVCQAQRTIIKETDSDDIQLAERPWKIGCWALLVACPQVSIQAPVLNRLSHVLRLDQGMCSLPIEIACHNCSYWK